MCRTLSCSYDHEFPPTVVRLLFLVPFHYFHFVFFVVVNVPLKNVDHLFATIASWFSSPASEAKPDNVCRCGCVCGGVGAPKDMDLAMQYIPSHLLVRMKCGWLHLELMLCFLFSFWTQFTSEPRNGYFWTAESPTCRHTIISITISSTSTRAVRRA
jgi:hypothetical protein